MTEPDIILIAHNLRSCYNVGSLLRTADGLGVKKVYLSGYTPYPAAKNDSRLPHLSEKINKRIKKSSLGAEDFVDWEYAEKIEDLINDLRRRGYKLIALEQTKDSVDLASFKTISPTALVLGREVGGVEEEILDLMDQVVLIPMLGSKESFNVAQAAAMALYKLRYFNN
jgi:23S rRNA (guanosine2251-2'-O)-methyltransferase